MQVINEGKDRLDRGYWVVVFPEGTRISPREPSKYNAGGAMLAARTGYTVVPVAHNAGSFWGKGFTITPGTVRVVIGEPIDTTEMKAGDINRMVEEWIQGQMANLE
jgi:1-acyl-sn-glycerol-3-phosphate acyltransferase